jgi:hypothetical protein
LTTRLIAVRRVSKLAETIAIGLDAAADIQ